jgi:ubiquitin C-terminal hydrolase
VDEEVRIAWVSEVAKKLMDMPEETLKKENSESLTGVLSSLSCVQSCKSDKLVNLRRQCSYHTFWMKFAAKLIKCNSFVLRLSGWDQIQAIISKAAQSRPKYDAYTVIGAGCDDVNGEYSYTSSDSNEFGIYVKPPHRPGSQPISLFRCLMKSKSFSWFISFVPPGHTPGTNRDVDYYEHRSEAYEDHEPQPTGWVNASASGSFNMLPCPTVVRSGTLMVPEGADPEMYLYNHFRKWLAQQSDLIANIFSAPHREILSRCSKLVCFLAEADGLTREHIVLIWKTVLSSHDPDTLKELIHIVVAMTGLLNEELFSCLVLSVLESLDAEDTLVQSGQVTPVLTKVAMTLECMAKSRVHLLLSSSSDVSTGKLLSLIWAVYKHSSFEQLKNKDAVQEFLSSCFTLPIGTQVAVASLQECLGELRRGEDFSDEDSVTRTLRTLQFLISKTVRRADLVVLENDGLADILVADIVRFMKVHISRQCSAYWYRNEISRRLSILLQFYELCDCKIPKPIIHRLWELLHHQPCEVDAIFCFFNIGLSNKGLRSSFVAPENLLFIFREYICSDFVDWASSDETSFWCFKNYYKALENAHLYLFRNEMVADERSESSISSTVVPPLLGLDTLWKITLNSQSAAVQSASTELLVKTYEDLAFTQPDAHVQLIERIFALFQFEQSGVDAHSAFNMHVCRGIELLYQLLLKSKEPREPNHAMRGCLQTIKLRVNHRRLQSYFNFNTHANALRTENGSEATYTIDVHPLNSLKTVKHKIAFAVGNGTLGCNIILEGLLADCPNDSLLQECNIRDGEVVSVHSRPAFTAGMKGAVFDDSMDHEIAALASVGEYISKRDDLFETLLRVAGTEHLATDIRSERTIRLMWTILMLIPTNPLVLDTLLMSAVDSRNGDNAHIWKELLSSGNSCIRTTYLLQIVDHILQPAADLQDAQILHRAENFKTAFIASHGFAAILDVYLSTSETTSTFALENLVAVCLHILYFLLLDSGETPSDNDYGEDQLPEVNIDLLALLEEKSEEVVGKLLSSACTAASSEDCGVAHNALAILTFLLRSMVASTLLVKNPSSKRLLLTVLRSTSEPVRKLAGDFAVKLGKSQIGVFDWLLAELKSLSLQDCRCEQLFSAIRYLIQCLYLSHPNSIQWADLGDLLVQRICSFPSELSSVAPETMPIIIGFMTLLETLLRTDCGGLSHSGTDFNVVTKILLDKYLFTWPVDGQAHFVKRLCETSAEQVIAFSLIKAIVSVSVSTFIETLQTLETMISRAAESTQRQWGLQPLFEMRSADIDFVGLKNQGCTCYISSLLQQLFMNIKFREAVLAAPLRECHRSSVRHRSPDSLVGCNVLIEWPNNIWKSAKILSFDETTKQHMIEYGSDDTASLDIFKGRPRQELGNVRMAPTEADDPVTEREEAAYRVLDQLQRVFYFMKHSMRRSFDPRPFVDACKSLNMNFNVYQQNDASEFCDQLLDRISTATKGRHTGGDLWEQSFEKYVFGGKYVYQKIPTECDIFENEMSKCGHWQSSRQESFLKIELNIKGKDNIHNSIADLVAGELMDGDNKINCDVCLQKKSTVRRTCLESLPNTLIIHLKRFDLDFTTFETVKLNSKLSFDRRINMMRYTKEGIEAEESERSSADNTKSSSVGEGKRSSPKLSSGGGVDGGVDDGGSCSATEKSPKKCLNLEDYEYELQGILVHAGVAQGGHYYSYACEKNDVGHERWFRFDDDDVTAFDPEFIPVQCFGGPSSKSHLESPSRAEEDRVANALMLFYNKVRPRVASNADDIGQTWNEQKPAISTEGSQSKILTGNEAFKNEVEDKNLAHLTTQYSLDPALQAFLRELLSSLVSSAACSNESLTIPATCMPQLKVFKWYPPKDGSKTNLAVVQFVCKYLFNVVLHCRERTAMKEWINVLRSTFISFHECAWWFVRHLMNAGEPSWFDIYLQSCTDSLARYTFVQIVVAAVQALATELQADVLLPFVSLSDIDLRTAFRKKPSTVDAAHPAIISLLALFAKKIYEKLVDIPLFVRVSDELILLVRDVSCVPCVRTALLNWPTISLLTFFVLPNQAGDKIRSVMEQRLRSVKLTNQPDFSPLFQNIYEAIAALVGVPQIKKVSLLQDRSLVESELVHDARNAFTSIFAEVARSGTMNATEVVMYKEKIGTKISMQMAKTTVDRFGTLDGRLNLDGFIQYYADLATYAPKEVWKDLHQFGFRNDLSRSKAVLNLDRSDAGSAVERYGHNNSADHLFIHMPKLHLQQECRKCLFNMKFYQVGLEVSEASAKAIGKRISYNDPLISTLLLRQVLKFFVTVL